MIQSNLNKPYVLQTVYARNENKLQHHTNNVLSSDSIPWSGTHTCHGKAMSIKLRDWSSVTEASASSSSAETRWHFVTCSYLPKKAFVDLHRKKGPTVATAVFLWFWRPLELF